MVIKKTLCIILYILVVCFTFAQENDSVIDDSVIDNLSGKKKSGFSLDVGYGHGWVFNSKYTDVALSPLSFSTRLSYITQWESSGNIGVELYISYFRTKTTPREINILITNTIPIAVNFVYQYSFNDRLRFYSYIGIGISFRILHFEEETVGKVSPTEADIGFLTDIGLGLQITLAPDLYAKVGVGYELMKPKDMLVHMLVPSLAVGYKF